MKNQIKIHNPCPESWETMQEASEGKFCEKCSKCVIDLTDKTDYEIQDIFKTADGKEICGRISTRSLSMVAAGIILVTNLTFVQAQTSNDFDIATEQKATDITKLSGRLIFKETQKVITNADVFFINKSKFLKTTTNENGYFSLNIPNDLIKEENVLYFNFDKLNEERRKEHKRKDTISGDHYGDQTIIFSRKEKIENKKFQIDYKGYEIGAVVIVNDPPPDYYYFNGKSINERKFEKLRKENPNYQFFFFKDKEAEVIARKGYVDTARLLFSN
jgi:hypothetical protein